MIYILIIGVLAIIILLLLIASGDDKSKTKGSLGKYSTDKNLLETDYSTDASWFKITPKAVYFPSSVQEIQNIVSDIQTRKQNGENISLSVRAGGTCMSGGSLTEGVIIDMTKNMNKVEINSETMTATVEAGAYFRDIEDLAKKHGLMFPAYPSSHRVCGIGGMIGNNASGEKSLRGGATGDNILELEVVLANGSVKKIRPQSLSAISETEDKAILDLYNEFGNNLSQAVGEVKKAASGYRLDKVVNGDEFNVTPLFVGAQGTLGIVTKAVLKLSPIPKYTELTVISSDSLAELPEILKIAFAHNPESLETFDINTFKKAKEYLAEHANHLLPYINEKAQLFILAQFSEDSREATSVQAEAFTQKLQTQGYFVKQIKNPLDVASAWQVRRNSFLLMRDHNPKGFRAVPCIEDVIVPIDKIGEFIDLLLPILAKHTSFYGFHGHIGDGSLRIIPVFDFRQSGALDKVFALMTDVFALVKSLKGNISADHSDGLIRTPFLREFYGDKLYETFTKIKNIYDPNNIMNPNKKVEGNIDLIRKYMN
jgi:FAD/FMN-containing dehydrogenase